MSGDSPLLGYAELHDLVVGGVIRRQFELVDQGLVRPSDARFAVSLAEQSLKLVVDSAVELGFRFVRDDAVVELKPCGLSEAEWRASCLRDLVGAGGRLVAQDQVDRFRDGMRRADK